MGRKASRKNQKIYKMKGCSKKTCRNFLGGSADVNLAYPSNNVPTVPNPFLAYTGKGGTATLANVYPNQGPPAKGFDFLNPQGAQRGGCGCSLLSGGSNKMGGCGPLCALGFMVGGTRHRHQCKCSECKMNGGQSGGNQGIPYPNGLVGTPWTPEITGWPGVNGIQGDNNYIAPNNYHTDIQTAMISTGANPPFSVGGRRRRKTNRRKTQKGGTFSNFLSQDLLNLGRQFQFGVGSTYNALSGYPAPTNPMPWKGQLANTATSLSTIKAASF